MIAEVSVRGLQEWTFERRTAVGFGTAALGGLLVTVTSALAVWLIVRSAHLVTFREATVVANAVQVRVPLQRNMVEMHRFYHERDPRRLTEARAAGARLDERLSELDREEESPEGRELVGRVWEKRRALGRAEETLAAMAEGGAGTEALNRTFNDLVAPAHERLEGELDAWAGFRGERLRALIVRSREAAQTATKLVIAGGAGGLLLALGLCYAFTRSHSRLYAQVREAVQVRDDFLSVASHELRTPLTALYLNIQSVKKDLRAGLPASHAETKLGLAERQARRLDQLISNLLDVARLQAERLPLELAPVDLSTLVRELLDRTAEDLSRSGSTVSLDAPAATVGMWDKARLEQVIANLLSNAIRFGQGRPIEIRLGSENGWATLVVRDRGIGIAPEDQARIFERFERAAAGITPGGFGLGLWIARQIIQALGGRIRVESQLGEGSTFTVELPKSPPPKPRELPASRGRSAAVPVEEL